jgi:CubicO group peptidase (beta-lactamase class C family)
MPFRLLALLAVIPWLALAQPAPQQTAEAEAACGAPSSIDDGWPVATPESAGFDGAALCTLVERVRSLPNSSVHGVVVVRRGALVFEQYFAGEDQIRGRSIGRVEFTPTVKHDLRSISKSVTSLLVGIAVDRGLIRSVDEPVFNFFPEYADLRTPERERITLRHLLTMSSGLAWDEIRPYTDSANSYIRMIYAPDPYRFALEQPVERPPGLRFNYGGGATVLLSKIVQKVTDQQFNQFAREALFVPLGITDIDWMRMPNGDTAAASGLRLRPRDIAKLGQLFLTRGTWNGRRILSAAWLDQSTTAEVEASDFLFYGYQLWLGRALIDKREVPWIAGFGLGGQRLFVVPSLDLVVVVTAGYYTSPMQRWVPWGIFRHDVLGALRNP